MLANVINAPYIKIMNTQAADFFAACVFNESKSIKKMKKGAKINVQNNQKNVLK